MKIGISCHALKHGGGMERYSMDLIAGLHELGIRPTVFARKFDQSLPQYAQVDAARIRVGWLPGKFRDHAFAVMLERRQAMAGIDVLIACNRVLGSQLAICGGTHLGFLRAMKRSPSVFDRWMTALERKHLARARVIIAHSRLMERELRELYGVAAERIRVVYPPVEAERFHPVDPSRGAALRKSLGLPSDRVLFVFPSSSHKRKGFDLLSKYFGATDLPIALAVAGRPVPRNLRNVINLGFRRDVEHVYQAADYTVLASRYEPFGLVGIESVLCGTPVLLASNMGCGEVIADDAKEEFTAHDCKSLDMAVRRALARTQAGEARLRNPQAKVLYSIDRTEHVRALLASLES